MKMMMILVLLLVGSTSPVLDTPVEKVYLYEIQGQMHICERIQSWCRYEDNGSLPQCEMWLNLDEERI